MDLRRVLPRHRSYLLLVFFLISGFQKTLSGQEECSNVEFVLDDITAQIGDNVCINISVNNFDSVTAFQFSINFNPTVIEYTNCLNTNNLRTFTCNSIITTSAADGILRVLWFESNATPVTLSDSTSIFQLCFDIIGDPGPSNPIVITDNPVSIEIVFDNNGNSSRTDSICVVGGSVNVTCSEFSINSSFCAAPEGTTDGSVSFSVCGGTPPYNYDFNGQAGVLSADNEVIIFQNLAPGVYPIVVTDDMGIVINDSLEIIAGDPLVLDFSTMNPPSCAIQRFPNGRIIASPTGGLAPYSYTWSTTPANIPTISNLENGEYSVTLNDANGCRMDSTITLFTDTLRLEAMVTDSALCEGSSRGGILLLNASGGTPFPGGGYNICATFENGQNVCTGQPLPNMRIINVPAGTISYRVTDGSQPVNRCTTEVQFIEMPFRKTVDLEVNTRDISCFGLGDGVGIPSFSVLIGDEDGPYTFELTDIQGNFIQGVNVPNPTYQFTDLEVDSFIINSHDGDGCEISDTFTIAEPPPVQLDTLAVEPPDCAGNIDDGFIDISGTGGTGALSYEWNDGSADQNRSGLGLGTYSVTATDDNNCQDSLSLELVLPDAIRIDSIELSHLGCPGDTDGSIEIIVGGNNTGATFDWGSGPVADNTLNGLTAGQYTVHIENQVGCFLDSTITIQSPEPLSVEPNPDPPVCPGGLGNLGVIVSGGTGNYSYQWIGYSSTDPVLVQVPAGNYSVRVSDDNGCSDLYNLTLVDPEKIDLSVNQIAQTLCAGDPSGRATAEATGGMDNMGIFLYMWSSGESDLGITHTADSLIEGRQWVIATDGICASDTVFFDVEAPQPLQIDETLTELNPPSCYGASDGSITAQIAGGTGPYTIMWPDYNQTGNEISNIPSDSVRVIVEDLNHCTTTDTLYLSQPDSLAVFIDSTATMNLNCFGEDSGRITVGYSGGNPGTFSYQWTNNVSTTSTALNLGPGNYIITVTDEEGCSAIAQYELTSSEEIAADIPVPEDPVCFGGQTCIGINSVSGGSGPNYRFSINNGPLFPVDTCITVFAGTYSVKVFDRNGCSLESNFTIGQPDEITVDLGPDLELNLGESGELHAEISPGTVIDSVFWNPVADLQCLNAECSQVQTAPTDDVVYQVYIKDIYGCMALDEVMVRVKRARNVYIPNIFQPRTSNANGNNLFKIYPGQGATLIEYLRIYNRFGNMMHSEENIATNGQGAGEWDGTFNGDLVNPGVYVYVAKVQFIDGESVIYKGTVTLVH